MNDYKISSRTSRVLNIFLMGLLFILARIWYLGVIDRETQLQNATKPQRRSSTEKVERATIRDRFNIPLATNKIQYNAAICYAQIRQIPTVSWKKEGGKRVKIYARKAHVEKLSELLARELSMDPLQIEDMIHGKASLIPHATFIVKEDIAEESYYRLKALEKEWFGLQMERSSKRIYPQGKLGCDVIGYMGMINSNEYYRIAQEIKELQRYLIEREEGKILFLPKGYKSPMEVRMRLKDLQERAYNINDLVGKSGIEKFFDETLRGRCGKKIFEVDTKGNYLRELPGSRPPASGQRLILTLSSELQKTAEELLASYELHQDRRDKDKQHVRRHPWIRGGAIVAMLPQTGEVVALASHPRFDPNDFTSLRDNQKRREKRSAILKWLENENHIGEIWDGKIALSRELFDSKKESYIEDGQKLTWSYYLDCLIPSKGALRTALDKASTLKIAVQIQETLGELLELSNQNSVPLLIDTLYQGPSHAPLRRQIKKEEKETLLQTLGDHADALRDLRGRIDPYLTSIAYNDDKLLFLDLIRVMAGSEDFTPSLLEQIGGLSFSEWLELNQGINRYLGSLQVKVEELYRTHDFANWRSHHFKKFLEKIREEEKKERKAVRPYPDYLDYAQKKMFKKFWEQLRPNFLQFFITGEADPALGNPYLTAILELRKMVPHDPQLEKVKTLLTKLPTEQRLPFLQSIRSFGQLNRPLFGKYPLLRGGQEIQLEKHLAAAFYPSGGFGFARSQAFRQSTPQGSIFKLAIAYEALKKRYAALEEWQRTLDRMSPLTLTDDFKWAGSNSNEQVLGFLENGQPIKRLYKEGRLPRSSHPNIGKIDLLGALEQSSNIYFSLLASDYIDNPTLLEQTARAFNLGEKTGIELPGEYGGSVPSDLAFNKTGLYSFAIGQHSLVVTPLQTAVMLSTIANGGKVLKPKIVQLAAGTESALDTAEDIFARTDYPLKENLSLIGVHFPLFTQTIASEKKAQVNLQMREVKRELYFPERIRSTLLEGMHQVLAGSKGTARAGLIRGSYQDPKALQAYQQLSSSVFGKTGTAEILYKQTIDAESKAEMEKHVWFGALSFSDEKQKEPELVVVVYLRFGDAGKDAAPLALRMIERWREINSSLQQIK